MRMTRALLRLYPASIREYWGSMLEADAQSAGWRSWPNIVAAAVDMWLHPVIWPAESLRERRHRAVAMALAVTVTIGIIGRAAAASDSTLSQYPPGAWRLTDCARLLAIGAALILPLPRPGRDAIAMLFRTAFRALAVPLFLVVGAIVFAQSAETAELSTAKPLVAACFWLALVAGAVQAIRVVCTTGSVVLTPPSSARLYLGFAVLITGCVLASWITIRAAVHGSGFDPLSAVTGAALLTLAFTLVSTLRDLQRC